MQVEDDWDDDWNRNPPWFPAPAPSASEPDVEMLELLASVLDEISERHAEVLRRRLGLGSFGPHTLQDIGEAFGVSRERVRQLEEKALARLDGHVTRSGADDPGALLAGRLASAFRSLRRQERGRYLLANFPDARRLALVRVVARVVRGVRVADVGGWLRAFEKQELAVEQQRRSAAGAARRTAVAQTKFSALLGGVLWPISAQPVAWPHLSPYRSTHEDGGHVFSSKLDRKVGFDSRLEASFIDLLERTPSVVEYCEQPLAIRYRWFDGERLYVPDFAIRMNNDALLMVEIKPSIQWADGINLAKWNGATRWCQANGWGFLVTDGRRHPGSMLRRPRPADGALLERLTENGPVRWPTTQSAWFDTMRSWDTLLATALRYGFALQRAPFEVRRARNSPWLDALHSLEG